MLRLLLFRRSSHRLFQNDARGMDVGLGLAHGPLLDLFSDSCQLLQHREVPRRAGEVDGVPEDAWKVLGKVSHVRRSGAERLGSLLVGDSCPQGAAPLRNELEHLDAHDCVCASVLRLIDVLQDVGVLPLGQGAHALLHALGGRLHLFSFSWERRCPVSPRHVQTGAELQTRRYQKRDRMSPKMTPTAADASQPTKLRQGFVTLAERLLTSLAEVFPECDAVDRGLHLFKRLVKGDAAREEQFISQCNIVFQQHAAALKERDVEALFACADELPVMKEVDVRAKWQDPGFDDASKENFWQYLTSLKLYAELFCAVPSGIIGKIESLATDLGAQLQSGELNLAKIDIAGIGNQLLGQLSAEETANFESSLPNIYASISEMAMAAAGQAEQAGIDVEGLMKNLVNSQHGGSTVDLTEVMQRIGGMADPCAGSVNPEQLMGLAQNIGPLLAKLQGVPQPPAAPKALAGARDQVEVYKEKRGRGVKR